MVIYRSSLNWSKGPLCSNPVILVSVVLCPGAKSTFKITVIWCCRCKLQMLECYLQTYNLLSSIFHCIYSGADFRVNILMKYMNKLYIQNAKHHKTALTHKSGSVLFVSALYKFTSGKKCFK